MHFKLFKRPLQPIKFGQWQNSSSNAFAPWGKIDTVKFIFNPFIQSCHWTLQKNFRGEQCFRWGVTKGKLLIAVKWWNSRSVGGYGEVWTWKSKQMWYAQRTETSDVLQTEDSKFMSTPFPMHALFILFDCLPPLIVSCMIWLKRVCKPHLNIGFRYVSLWDTPYTSTFCIYGNLGIATLQLPSVHHNPSCDRCGLKLKRIECEKSLVGW